MQRRLSEIAEYLEAELWGESGFVVTGLQSPEDATSSDLIVLLDPSWIPAAQASAARVIVIGSGQPPAALAERFLLQVKHPREAFAKLLALFYPAPALAHRISDKADIASNAKLAQPLEIGAFVTVEAEAEIGAGTKIGPNVTIGAGSRIGRDCRIGAQVVLAPGTVLGDRVVIHAGTIIGADGYGFYQKDGRHHKIPQVGIVRIEDDVEIGANVTIDRATLGETVIGTGTKIDNLVQIGHNVRIGKHCLLISQVGIAGSSELGDYVTLAGQVGVAGHLKIGDRVLAAGKSGITKDIPADSKISGFPAQEHRLELRQQAALRRLPELLGKITLKQTDTHHFCE